MVIAGISAHVVGWPLNVIVPEQLSNGELTLYSSDDPTCTGRPFGAGQGFVDSGEGHVHIAQNLTSQNTEVWVTHLDVPPGGSVRIDAADPGNCVF